MENILIIGLDCAESLFSLGRLIKNMPDKKISILAQEIEINAASLIPGVDKIYLLETKEIGQYLNNQLFSDALAINLLSDTLALIEQESWDKIINFGKTKLGDYLSSYFCLKYPAIPFIGYRCNSYKKRIPLDKWHILSHVLKDYTYNPLNDLEISHQALERNLQLSTRERNKNQGDIKVGIQIPRFTDDKNLPFKTLIEFIDILKTDLNYFPILLFDPADSNDEYAGKINRYFDNELEIISTNYLNLTKVLPILDSLITIKSNLKNLAQQMGIPVIEIIYGKARPDTTWAPGKGDLTVTCMDRIRGEDLYNILTRQFDLIDPMLKIFHSQQDLIGAYPRQLRNDQLSVEDLSFLMSRYLISKLYLDSPDSELLSEITNFSRPQFADWQIKEKEEICEVSRIIFNLLRILKQIPREKEKLSEFGESIDELISLAKSNRLVAIPILLFQYQIDLIDLESIEELIFNLKNSVQGVVIVLKDLENALRNKKKQILIEKSIKNKTLNL